MASSSAAGLARMSVSFSMPCSRRRAAVTGPTPHSASTGSPCRNDSTRSGATTVRPSGFFHPDAIFARNLFGATPADAVSCVVSRMAVFSRRATFTPSGSCQAFSVTSRYASSSDNGSTSGVTSRKMRKHLLRHRAVLLEVGPHDDERRAQPHRARHGNRRPHAERPRLVAGGRDHAPRRRVAAHRDRLAAQRRVVALLDRRVKRVHVDVEDLAHGGARLKS